MRGGAVWVSPEHCNKPCGSETPHCLLLPPHVERRYECGVGLQYMKIF